MASKDYVKAGSYKQKIESRKYLFYWYLLEQVKMACLAIKSNLSACRNYACNETDFCSCHQNITVQEMTQRWKEMYLSYEGVSLALKTDAQVNVLLEQVARGYVKLTEKDVAKIPADRMFADVFLELVGNGLAKAEWNMPLYACCVEFLLELVNLKAYSHPLLTAIPEILVVPSPRDFDRFLVTLAIMEKKQMIPREYYPSTFAFLIALLETRPGTDYCWSNPAERLGDVLRRELEKTNGTFSRFLDSRFWPESIEILRTDKQYMKAKMDYIKEELMQFCWHPLRVAKYLEMGLDIDEL